MHHKTQSAIVDGCLYVQAAGVIHSDFERGFIRAETVAYDDFVKCGSLSKARDTVRLILIDVDVGCVLPFDSLKHVWI